MPERLKRDLFRFCPGDSEIFLGRETKLMGVLNVTPDSFSDGGLFVDPAVAEKRALQMQFEGAHFLDIGGESTRPGARPVSAREEIRRIRPVLRRLSKNIKIPISVDTYKYEVAQMALDEGAVIINDVYALRGNKRLASLITRHKAGVVLMHMRGRPETMQNKPVYKNMIKDILRDLRKSIDLALSAGISRSRIVVDPGFGFGKTAGQNLEMLSCLRAFSALKLPVLAGLSRKSFLGNMLGLDVKERLYASLAAGAAAIHRGAHILRVHDVAAHKQMTIVTDACLSVN